MLIKLLDVEYWWTDLRSANEQMIEPEWEKRYSAKVSYNMEDMTVNSQIKVNNEINTNETVKSIYDNIWNKGLYQ